VPRMREPGWAILAGVAGMLVGAVGIYREMYRQRQIGSRFDDQSPDFRRGVEYGLVFARITDEGRVDWTVHADLAEALGRLADRKGLPFAAAPHEHGPRCWEECIGRHDCRDGEDWLDVTIG
jgi:hypothetical protein